MRLNCENGNNELKFCNMSDVDIIKHVSLTIKWNRKIYKNSLRCLLLTVDSLRTKA